MQKHTLLLFPIDIPLYTYSHIIQAISPVAWADNSDGFKVALVSGQSYYYRILAHAKDTIVIGYPT